MAYLEKKLKHEITKNFKETFSTDDNYMVFSSTENVNIENNYDSEMFVSDTVLFGKKIRTEDIIYAIKDEKWISGTVYDEFVDNMSMTSKCIITVYPDEDEVVGDYRIFMCLFNNYNAPSTEYPTYVSGIPEQIYHLADGYTWKYLYSLNEAEFSKFNTNGYIGIANESFSDVTLPLHEIKILNPLENKGYDSDTGNIISVRTEFVDKRFYLDGAETYTESFFENYSFFVMKNSAVSKLFEIKSFLYDSAVSKFYVTLKDNDADNFIIVNSTYSILPKITISGNGTGAQAIPIIENNRIKKIQMISYGENYSRAIVEIIPPRGFLEQNGVSAILKPVLYDDHDSIIDFLLPTAIMIINTNNITDNEFIPTTNFYSKLSLMNNLEFVSETSPSRFDNRIKLKLTTSEEVGSRLSQVNNSETIFTGKIHEKNGDYIWLCEFNSHYPLYENTGYSLNPNLPFRTNGGDILTVGLNDLDEPDITYPDYIQRSGHIFYINTFNRIERTNESFESYKILLQF